MDSQFLGQQQLLEPPARRRIIVPVGRSAWWGVDGSTLRIALAGVCRASDGSWARWVKEHPFAAVEGPARLSEIYRETHRFVTSVATCCPWPGIVLVEQPSGGKQKVNLPLIYAVGVMQAAVYDALFSVMGSAPVMETCTSSWWKARACGRGDIYKPKRERGAPRPELEEYGVFRWARDAGWDVRSWDQADAAGMADAARREVALDER